MHFRNGLKGEHEYLSEEEGYISRPASDSYLFGLEAEQ